MSRPDASAPTNGWRGSSPPRFGAQAEGSRLAGERLWSAALAAAAVYAIVAEPRVIASYAGLVAAAAVLMASAGRAAGRLAPARAALLGLVAAVLALIGAAFGGASGSAVSALAVASLGGVAPLARNSRDAAAGVLLVVAAAGGGVAARGEVEVALALAGLVAVAAIVVVFPAHALILDLTEVLRWARRSEGSRRDATPSATGEELERAQAEMLAARQALLQANDLRKQAELQALDALRTKDAFLARMSHELRTPVNQILGYSELLLEEGEGADAAQIRADVERICVASRNLIEVLDNTLDLSSIEAGKQKVQLEVLPVHEFSQELIDSAADAARRRGNTLRLRCSPEVGVLRTDRVKLRKILGALLSNACKFTENGTIRLAIRRESERMCFAVSDTGIGITPEALARLFEPFYQADDSSTRRHDGAGLGLTVCKHLTGMLGGEIEVQSEPGQGSTFTVRLPLEFTSPRAAGVVLMSVTNSSGLT